MNRAFRTLGLLALSLLLPWLALAEQVFPTDTNHRGLVSFGTYQVFPENRLGNGVYEGQHLVFSAPAKSVISVLALPKAGRFIYFAKDSRGRQELNIHVMPGDSQPTVNEMPNGFYYVSAVLDGLMVKKLYRVGADNTINDMLPFSNTADGLTQGGKGIVFYHVSKPKENDPSASGDKKFPIRLHLALFEENRVRHLASSIYNSQPSLKLSWKDNQTISIVGADGKVLSIPLTQFH